MKTECKAYRSVEMDGSSCKSALEIKDTLKSEGKEHAKILGKSPKTRRCINIPKNSIRDDEEETFVFTAITDMEIDVLQPMQL
jgi:hypothetical protein